MLLLWLNTLTTELKRRGTLICAYQIFPSKVGTCFILRTEIGPDPQLEGIGTVEFSLAVCNIVPGRFGKRLKLNSPVKSLLFPSALPCPEELWQRKDMLQKKSVKPCFVLLHC